MFMEVGSDLTLIQLNHQVNFDVNTSCSQVLVELCDVADHVNHCRFANSC